ncbi:Calmodulin-binding transcription activator [Dermatophagoides pteronyssinus]|uniref:Calmodulin-binding transcription activator n=1 Tax=Dermatophagoides pteronyssinus TaxID=6956 RepID=A0ABQ8J0I6_DERPT|nr:Calmodulin-binding transcription activator [Dermatophagoides pteronyssinus]
MHLKLALFVIVVVVKLALSQPIESQQQQQQLSPALQFKQNQLPAGQYLPARKPTIRSPTKSQQAANRQLAPIVTAVITLQPAFIHVPQPQQPNTVVQAGLVGGTRILPASEAIYEQQREIVSAIAAPGEYFPKSRHRWNTNEEIAALLISIDQHDKWLTDEVKLRPKSGSMLLYSRKQVRYRRDGYCWKKRKDGKTTREDHMKLKVQGIECIYGCYVHSAILPTFHRRCYWLLQNPDIVLVHYLNVPYNDDNKIIIPSINSLLDTRKEWTQNGEIDDELERSTLDTIELIVQQLLIKQRVRLKTLEESIISLATSSSTTTMTSTTTTTTLSNHFKNQQSNNDLIRQQQQIKTHQIFTSLSSGQIMDAQTLSKKSSSTLKPDQYHRLQQIMIIILLI